MFCVWKSVQDKRTDTHIFFFPLQNNNNRSIATLSLAWSVMWHLETDVAKDNSIPCLNLYSYAFINISFVLQQYISKTRHVVPTCMGTDLFERKKRSVENYCSVLQVYRWNLFINIQNDTLKAKNVHVWCIYFCVKVLAYFQHIAEIALLSESAVQNSPYFNDSAWTDVLYQDLEMRRLLEGNLSSCLCIFYLSHTLGRLWIQGRLLF